MKRAVLIAFLGLAAPLHAQDAEPDAEGRDLMGEALRLFMKGLMQEMEPAMEDFQGFLENFDAYHPPEVLPNGDIIIRRKRPLDAGEDGEVEL